MATIHREIDIACDPEQAWGELRDFSSAARLFAGVLTDCRENAGLRAVTFANGAVVQEQLIAVDEARHRIAYTVVTRRRGLRRDQAQPRGNGVILIQVFDCARSDLGKTGSGGVVL